MRFCIVLFLSVLVVDHSACMKRKTVKLPPEVSTRLFSAVQQCMTKTGVPIEGVFQILQGGYSETRNFKDFIFCAYKEVGYLKPDGSINIEKIMRLFKNEPIVTEGSKKCVEKTSGKTPKEAVFNFFKCFQDTVPIIFSL